MQTLINSADHQFLYSMGYIIWPRLRPTNCLSYTGC
jgi:hypothetical protein